jgi:hypothetical protein
MRFAAHRCTGAGRIRAKRTDIEDMVIAQFEAAADLPMGSSSAEEIPTARQSHPIFV